MKQQFTQEDMVRSIYGESSYLEQMAIRAAQKSNQDFAEEYQSLQTAEALLSSVELRPPNFAIQNILNYSSSSQFEAEAG